MGRLTEMIAYYNQEVTSEESKEKLFSYSPELDPHWQENRRNKNKRIRICSLDNPD